MPKYLRPFFILSDRWFICGVIAIVNLLCLYPAIVKGQSTMADTNAVKNLVASAEKYNDTFAPEKLYLHFDRSYYAAGDTAWFKAYVFNATGKAAAASAKLYVELLNDESKVVQRLALPVFEGLAQGFIPLEQKNLPEGAYIVRAYTNWLQNFGDGYFFYKQLSLGKVSGKTWLITEQHKYDIAPDTNRLTLAMRFSSANGAPLILKPFNVKVMEGKKSILNSNLTTGVDGTLSGKLTLTGKVDKRNLNIYIEDAADKTQHISFPFYPSGGGGDIDLQFMPEGGNLIAGIYNKVGFKAIGEDGLHRPVKGVIVDNTGEESGALESMHNGMGSFVLVPQAGKTYVAKVTINGKEHKYKLPQVKQQGLGLRVDGINHPDELYVYVTGNTAGAGSYMLVAQSAGGIYFASAFRLNGEGYFNTRIPKSKFATGIVNLAILATDQKKIASRSVFIDHHDGLQIITRPTQPAYQPGDSLLINVQAANNAGLAAQGSFSVTVTDDAQTKGIPSADNIQSHILLASELKGNIENPAWYFEPGDEKLKAKALDNLLITQGWQGFDTDKLVSSAKVTLYKAEIDISVSGKLTNLFNKPAKGLKVLLMAKSKYDNAIMDTVSGNDGRFKFSQLPMADSSVYLVKLHNNKDKTAAANIEVDEFTPTNTNLPPITRPLPWNINADTSLINYMNSAGKRQAAGNFVPPSGQLLKQVDIKAQRVTKYVGGEFATELMVIDEKEMIAAQKMSLLDLIYKKFPGIKMSRMYAGSVFARTKIQADEQFVYGSLLINDVIADGQSVADPGALVHDISEGGGGINAGSETPKPGEFNMSSKPTKKDMFDRMREFLNTVGADDVKNLSLYRGNSMYLVVETRSKHGPFTRQALGTFAYRPLPLQLPRKFYSPKYAVKNDQPDLRSTIHWEPNLVTDAEGKAKLSFYAADKPGTYTVTIEGTDMQGHFGVSTQKIVIK